MKTYAIVASFVVDPEVTPAVVVVITIPGAVPSYVHANVLDTVLAFPAASVNVPTPTETDVAPSPDGVNVAVYVVPLPDRVPNVPPETVMSSFTKLVVAWPAVKTYAIVASFVVDPEVTPTVVVVITIPGAVVSCVYANWVAAVFWLPDASVNLFAATSIVAAPSPVGVNVAVYTVVEPPSAAKSLNAPLETEISVTMKLVVGELEVNVRVVAALNAPPLDMSADVIVIVGPVPSYVHANVLDTVLAFPAASVNVPAATATDVAPSPDGVNVAVYTVVESALNEPSEPPVTVMSLTSKLVVA